MAWIESHQALGNHPKTLALANELGCSRALAVGYLHLLWWWCLDYAKDGQLRYPASVIAAACDLAPDAGEEFLKALVMAGFVERKTEGVFIHDWREYTGLLIEKRAANAARMRNARALHVQDGVQARVGLPTNQPVRAPAGARAREAGAGAPLALSLKPEDQPTTLPNGAKQCPLCPEVFTSSYDEHLATSPRHKVRAEPEDFGRGKKRRQPASQPDHAAPMPPLEQLADEHERLLALEHAHQ